MLHAICGAIAGRRVIECFYDGGVRRVEPYCHGLHAKTGKDSLRAFQISGHSKSGTPLGWKMLTVAKIQQLIVTAIVFETNREGYDPDDDHICSVHCHV